MRRAHRLIVSLLLLAAVAAALWWGWMGWDDEYYTDPATGYAAGPYSPWQVIGCVLSLVLVALLAYRFVDRIAVGVAMTIGFTAAYAATVVPGDESGLSVIGVALVLTGMAGAAAVLGALDGVVAVGLQRVRRSRAPGFRYRP